jgi:hypothetical protein
VVGVSVYALSERRWKEGGVCKMLCYALCSLYDTLLHSNCYLFLHY